jgi:hypothetical protein
LYNNLIAWISIEASLLAIRAYRGLIAAHVILSGWLRHSLRNDIIRCEATGADQLHVSWMCAIALLSNGQTKIRHAWRTFELRRRKYSRRYVHFELFFMVSLQTRGI